MLFSALLVGLLSLGLFVDPWKPAPGRLVLGAPLLVALFTLPALHELVTLFALSGMPLARAPLLWAGFGLLAGKTCIRWRGLQPAGAWFLALLVLEVVALAVWLMRDRDLASGARRSAAAVASLGFVALLATMIDAAYDFGTPVLFALVLTAKAGDIGGYVFGKSMGRRKLSPTVSPKKTVEGALGGLALAMAVGAALFAWLCDARWSGGGRWTIGEVLVVALFVNVAGQVGDLFESLIKRAAGVKDSGQLLPEMGGALDVVDSLFLSMPVGAALLAILA